MKTTRMRLMTLSLLGLAALIGVAPAHAATITVDNTTCTLPNAVTAANTDTATNGCTAGSGADTLVIPPGTPTITLSQIGTTLHALPDVTSNITIQGNGVTLASAGGDLPNGYRLVKTSTGGNLTLDGLTVSGFQTVLAGGAIGCSFQQTLTITNSTLSNNKGVGGGAINSSCVLTISNSLITGNSSTGSGGGLRLVGDTTVINNSTIAGNSVNSPSIIIAGGGGIYANGGSTTLNNVTVVNNTVTGTGSNQVVGGGIFVDTSITLKNSLVAGNSVTCGNINPCGNEIIKQTSATVTANAYNLFGHAGETDAQAFGTYNFVSAGNSTFAAGSGVPAGANDIKATSNGTNVGLTSIVSTALANNGGPTQTLALIAGSPATNAADANFTNSTPTAGTALRSDQRNYGRLNGDTRRDIGAFEFGGVALPAVGPITVTPGDAQLSVSFTAPSDNGGYPITNYKYSTDNGATYTAVNPASTTSPVVITGLTNGTTYPVKLRAVVAESGDGAESAAVSGAPLVQNADGVCATLTGPLTTAPSAGLCTSGTATAVTSNTNNYTWGCNGVGTGAPTAANACSVSRGFTVTPTAGANGSISPSIAQVIAAGQTTPFTVTPAANYKASITGCNGTQTGNSFTTGAITADCGVAATFALNAAPVASNVAITGSPQVGQVLTGSYSYSDAESDAQGTSLRQWKRADNAAATPADIASATSNTYTPVAEDAGKVLQFCVTPVASAGTTTGTPVCSAFTTCTTSSTIASCGNVTGTGEGAGKTASVKDSSDKDVTLALSNGGGKEQIVYVRRVSNAGSPPAGSGVVFNNGVFDYLVTGLPTTGGASITITITLPTGTPTPTAIYKCKGDPATCAVPTLTTGESITVNGNVITLVLKDGGALDQDGSNNNGQILDPIAPAFPAPAAGGSSSSGSTGGGFPPVSSPPSSGSPVTAGGSVPAAGSSGSTSGDSSASGTTGGTTTTSLGTTTGTTSSSGGCTTGSGNTGLQWLVLLAALGFIARRRQVH